MSFEKVEKERQGYHIILLFSLLLKDFNVRQAHVVQLWMSD